MLNNRLSRSIRRFVNEPLKQVCRTNRALSLLGLASLGLLAGSVIMALIDPRIITGAPAWNKPIKFAVSATFYTLTLAWMLGYVRGHDRLVGLVGNLTSLALGVELILIDVQVVRGMRSHFNFTTPLDTAIFVTMGVLIAVVWVVGLLAVVLLVRQKLTDRVLAWSLRLGLFIALVGASIGFLMTRPTPNQMAQLQAGKMQPIIGAHSVGVEDGGPGLPFLGWSTQGGDLRAPHFFGLHALQVIPLAGLALSRLLRRRLNETRRVALLWTVSAGYLGWVLLLTWQALRGQSIIAPDGLTLAAVGGLALGVVASFGIILASQNRSNARISYESYGD